MSETTDDLEFYSGELEIYEEDKLVRSLEAIVNAKPRDFESESHMINYIKKIAKNILDDL